MLASHRVPQTDAQDAQEIESLVERLGEMRRGQSQLQEALLFERGGIAEQIAQLRDDLEIAQARSVAAAELQGMQEARLAVASSLSDRIASGMAPAIVDALALCELLGASVSAGIPYRRTQRSREFARLAGELKGAERTDQSADALVGLLAVLGEELRLAESIEDRSEELELSDGRRVHAYVVRLGLVQEAFVSEDGLDVGISLAGEAWRTDLTELEREAVAELVATARGRRSATLVPVSISGGSR